jgi:hypothetical protein
LGFVSSSSLLLSAIVPNEGTVSGIAGRRANERYLFAQNIFLCSGLWFRLVLFFVPSCHFK